MADIVSQNRQQQSIFPILSEILVSLQQVGSEQRIGLCFGNIGCQVFVWQKFVPVTDVWIVFCRVPALKVMSSLS